jgi:hypothetical protein
VPSRWTQESQQTRSGAVNLEPRLGRQQAGAEEHGRIGETGNRRHGEPGDSLRNEDEDPYDIHIDPNSFWTGEDIEEHRHPVLRERLRRRPK